jgi:GTP-binding protein
MPKPVVVIIGRPNVGKSTLFNRIVGTGAAIVEDLPGVTRDRNYLDAEYEGRHFVVVDTGGFYARGGDLILEQMKEQALFAVEEADMVIHLLDGREEVNPHDREIADILRASGKRTLWAVNKLDSGPAEQKVYDFYSLGVPELLPLSAATGLGFHELMERVVEGLPEAAPETAEHPKVAVVGRPNVGKSTLVNALLGKDRMLVSPVAGTTRDAIDSVCSYYRRKYLLIDTAGIRRKDRRGYSVERFALVRALRSIGRCDVAVLMMDASAGIVSEDVKIAGLIQAEGKGVVLVVNKWDLVEEPEAAYKKLGVQVSRKLWFFSHAPVLTTSGTERRRVTKLFPLVDKVMAERRKRISTPELNRFLPTLTLPTHRGKRVKLYYATQTGTQPPAFALFTNMPQALKEHHVRHIESRLREAFGFAGTPVRIRVRERSRR